jgi:MYXO-CTERM domain-containing protein
MAAAALVSLGAAGARAANIVQDPGFEAGPSGNGAFWTFSNWRTGPVDTPVNSGLYDASTGCVGASCVDPTSSHAAFVSQALSTVAGQHYDLSFWFGGDAAPDELKVLWGANTVLDLQGAQIVSNAGSGETLYTVAHLFATGPSTVLAFFGRQDPGYDGLDDVSVTPSVSGVPEPPAWGFMMLGLLGAGAALRGRRSRVLAA